MDEKLQNRRERGLCGRASFELRILLLPFRLHNILRAHGCQVIELQLLRIRGSNFRERVRRREAMLELLPSVGGG